MCSPRPHRSAYPSSSSPRPHTAHALLASQVLTLFRRPRPPPSSVAGVAKVYDERLSLWVEGGEAGARSARGPGGDRRARRHGGDAGPVDARAPHPVEVKLAEDLRGHSAEQLQAAGQLQRRTILRGRKIEEAAGSAQASNQLNSSIQRFFFFF